MAERSKKDIETPRCDRLREEHGKVVKDCDSQIQHWKKLEGDYDALNERLETLPDQLSYDVMVPFGPLAFIPGKLVHTNEINVLLGDNWFAKCSTKQAQKIVGHRKQHVKTALDDLHKTRKNFEARVRFTEDLEKRQGGKGDFVDIREEVENVEKIDTKGKRRVAHKPHSKPKMEALVDLEEEDEEEEEEKEEEEAGGRCSRRESFGPDWMSWRNWRSRRMSWIGPQPLSQLRSGGRAAQTPTVSPPLPPPPLKKRKRGRGRGA